MPVEELQDRIVPLLQGAAMLGLNCLDHGGFY
jgi:hypothetical protein